MDEAELLIAARRLAVSLLAQSDTAVGGAAIQASVAALSGVGEGVGVGTTPPLVETSQQNLRKYAFTEEGSRLTVTFGEPVTPTVPS